VGGLGPLRAAFVRSAGERDRIYVTRSDGSQTSWVFPTYGDALPHDLVHLVVESAFGLTRGFWGRVDEGADPAAISAEANRRGGKNKYAAFGPDQRELLLAEALANASWSADSGPLLEQLRQACADAGESAAAPTRELALRVQSALASLAARWRGLRPKGAIDVSFDRAAPRASFEELTREPPPRP
jgi:hypothetical protein